MISSIRGICICCLLLMFSPLAAQNAVTANTDDLQRIYEETLDKYGTAPLLRNGVFYEYPYFSAEGHPFLHDNNFSQGAVHYRNKYYPYVSIKYDIFHQQVILNQEQAGEMVQIKLTEEFVPAFSIGAMHFRKLTLEEASAYYQVVAEAPGIMSCRYWHKSRNESHDNKAYKTFVFGEEQYRNYVLIGDRVSRFRNNRTFVKAFPDTLRKPLRDYLRSNDIHVRSCNAATMQQLIDHCHRLLKK